MKPIRTFKVRPHLPSPLLPLLRIAHNLRWSWDHAAIELFRRIDRELWEASGHNPVLLLGNADQSALEKAAADDSFVAHMTGVAETLESYLSGEGNWYSREHSKDELLVAYFSAEFGITECLSICAGGLGVLAGDHLKAASDLGLPLVGVGLLYQQGYFRQYLNAAGWQLEAYEDNDFHTLPIRLVPNLIVHVDLPHGPVAAQVWSVNVGRLQLFLLDTNTVQNSSESRKITYQLYGGDLEMRLKQEILFGIGGYRALEAMGLEPTVYHMNEGHSAFLGLERVVGLMETQNLSFREARVLASASLIFTTHTPVAAGHDYFPADLMNRHFHSYAQRLGITPAEFLGLGQQNPANQAEDFCMTVLALRLACFSNGVSKLHGDVSRRMGKNLWTGVPESEVPIGHVTNGVHFRSWVSFEMNQLYDRYLGPKWREEPADPKLWERTESIPAGELWRTHERRRERLVAHARQRLRAQLVSRGAPQAAIDDAEEVLSPLLEGEIVPAFYERRADGLPRKWIARMKSSIALLCPEFNMHRMVKQYTNDYYLVAHDRYLKLNAECASQARHMAAWLGRVEEAWPLLRVESVEDSVPELDLGDRVQLSARVFLDVLTPDDLVVESVLGRVSGNGEIGEFATTPMQPCRPGENGRYDFQCVLQPKGQSGLYGYAVRVLPRHPYALSRFLPGLIVWAAKSLSAHA